MRKIPANQITQQMYGSKVTYSIDVKRGKSVHTIVLGHAQCDGHWVVIRAKGAHPFDAVRIPYDSIVQVAG